MSCSAGTHPRPPPVPETSPGRERPDPGRRTRLISSPASFTPPGYVLDVRPEPRPPPAAAAGQRSSGRNGAPARPCRASCCLAGPAMPSLTAVARPPRQGGDSDGAHQRGRTRRDRPADRSRPARHSRSTGAGWRRPSSGSGISPRAPSKVRLARPTTCSCGIPGGRWPASWPRCRRPLSGCGLRGGSSRCWWRRAAR